MMITPKEQIDVKELRKKAGRTVQQVADMIGVTRTTVVRWEAGLSQPMISLDQVILLVMAYDCTIEELADGFRTARENRGCQTIEASQAA